MSENHNAPRYEDSDVRQRPEHKREMVGVDMGSVTVITDAEDVQKMSDRSGREELDMLYTINDNPPWYLCILLGLQHYLTAFGATISIPLILAPAFCLGPNDVGTAELLSTLIFMSGLITVLQSTIGIRLPIIQGGSFAYLTPTFAILSLPKWECPSFLDVSNTTLYNDTVREIQEQYREQVWHDRVREVQGAIMLASLFQVLIGASGVMGLLLKFIGPLAIAPTIALVGIALFVPAANNCEGQWWIAIATMVCIMVFSQLLSRCDIPCCQVTTSASGSRVCTGGRKLPLFKLFPMLLAICLMWLICYILTETNTLSPNPNDWGYLARTDTKIEVLHKAKWFRFPYPFQWGMPTFSVAGVFGMLAGVIAGMLESLGDYYACARLSGAPPPPVHAINRGILIEGIGCVLSGMWGSGNSTTSYSENVGAIGITRVGSRVVVQTAGLVMLALGMLGKFGALFVTIPTPIIGGVFMVTFGMITAVGMSNLQYVNMNTSRNLFIVGFSFFFGLSLPQWMSSHTDTIHTGNEIVDQIFTVLLSTSMFVGGTVGFILDNIIPGTDEERGIKAWRQRLGDTGGCDVTMTCYDLPWCMGCLSRASCLKYIPFCPTFNFSPSCSCRKNEKSDDLSSQVTINKYNDKAYHADSQFNTTL